MPIEKTQICKWPCQEPGQTGWVPELVSTMLLPYVHQPSSCNPDSLVNFVTQYLPERHVSDIHRQYSSLAAYVPSLINYFSSNVTHQWNTNAYFFIKVYGMNELDNWTCQRVVLLQYNENPKNTSDKQLNGPLPINLQNLSKIFFLHHPSPPRLCLQSYYHTTFAINGWPHSVRKSYYYITKNTCLITNLKKHSSQNIKPEA